MKSKSMMLKRGFLKILLAFAAMAAANSLAAAQGTIESCSPMSPKKTAAAQYSSSKEALMSLSPYERAVLICKFFETMHYGKGKYIGYGHCILPGESYKPNERLSKAEADALLRRDLLGLHKMFLDYGRDSWLLAALAYNVGPYALLGHGDRPKSELLKAIEEGRRDIEKIYASYCKFNGKRHKGLLRRRLMELELLYAR